MDWLVVTSPVNFEVTCGLGLVVQGFKGRHRGKALGIHAGDRLVYYLTGVGVFAASAHVKTDCFEEHTRIWNSPGHPEEMYPWRVGLAADLWPPRADCPKAMELVDRLEFVKRWPAAHWRLAFQGMLRGIPQADFDVIRCELASRSPRQGLEGRPG